MYINNLPADSETVDVHSICGAFGTVQAIELRGSQAFVDFADAASRDSLIASYNGVRRSYASDFFQERTTVVNSFKSRRLGHR